MFAKEWFLPELNDDYIDKIIASFAEQGLIRQHGEQLEVIKAGDNQATLEMLGKVVHHTLLRYAIVIGLLSQSGDMSPSELEKEGAVVANRLGTLHGIKSPEFFDKKVLTGFITSLKEQGLVHQRDNALAHTDELVALYQDLQQLLPARLWQSISDAIAAMHAGQA